jgi:hypothetical protein
MRSAVLAVLALFAAVPASAEQIPVPSFLSGAWQMRDGERWAEEFWTPSHDEILLGAGMSGAGERLRSWEQMRIERTADGGFRFVAMPQGAPPVAFEAIGAGDDWIEFMNRENDYPQRIRYWRQGESLRARISLADGSNPTEWTFVPMSR